MVSGIPSACGVVLRSSRISRTTGNIAKNAKGGTQSSAGNSAALIAGKRCSLSAVTQKVYAARRAKRTKNIGKRTCIACAATIIRHLVQPSIQFIKINEPA